MNILVFILDKRKTDTTFCETGILVYIQFGILIFFT